jgi:hypothetical protein
MRPSGIASGPATKGRIRLAGRKVAAGRMIAGGRFSLAMMVKNSNLQDICSTRGHNRYGCRIRQLRAQEKENKDQKSHRSLLENILNKENQVSFCFFVDRSKRRCCMPRFDPRADSPESRTRSKVDISACQLTVVSKSLTAVASHKSLIGFLRSTQ